MLNISIKEQLVIACLVGLILLGVGCVMLGRKSAGVSAGVDLGMMSDKEYVEWRKEME